MTKKQILPTKEKARRAQVAYRSPKPGQVGVKGPRKVKLTVDQYNAMFKAYQERPTLTHAAAAAGVSVGCAKHYIDGPGAPEIGFEPIGQRVARINAAVNEHQDLTLLNFKKRSVKEWVEVLKLSDAELAVHRRRIMALLKRATEGEDVAPEQPFLSSVRARSEATKVIEHLLDAPDMTIAIRRDYDPLPEMEDDELRDYARTGEIPARLRR